MRLVRERHARQDSFLSHRRAIGARGGRFWAGLTVVLMVCWPGFATAQTAITSASNDLLCAADRAGFNFNCTAGEFTSLVQFQQPPGGATECLAGSTFTLSVIANLSGTNANRYDGAIYFGENANDPRVAGGQCSVSRFPIISTGTGFSSFDGDQCGDYVAGGVESWQINNVQVACEANAGGTLQVPYMIVYNQNDPGICGADTSLLLVPGSPSKCNSGTVPVPTVAVRGWVRVIKQTQPDGASDIFNFSASAPLAGNVSPASFSLSDGQEQLVQMTLAGSTNRTLTITEALTPAWNSTASIVCTNPTGGAATYVTVNNATRTISANLNNVNYGAICTITNTRQTRVRTLKALSPTTDPGVFNLTAAGTTVSNVGNGGTTGYVAVTPGTTATFSESAGTATSLANYITTYQCVREDTGAVVASGSGTTVSLVPTVQADTTCTFTNRRRAADLTLTKTNTPGVNGNIDQAADAVTSGATTSYSIVIANAGPDSADGSVVTDPPPTGATCTSATCTAAGGAACPAQTGASLVTALQSAGATIPTLPNGGSVTITMTCTVN